MIKRELMKIFNITENIFFLNVYMNMDKYLNSFKVK